jgi:hypothetical protein
MRRSIILPSPESSQTKNRERKFIPIHVSLFPYKNRTQDCRKNSSGNRKACTILHSNQHLASSISIRNNYEIEHAYHLFSNPSTATNQRQLSSLCRETLYKTNQSHELIKLKCEHDNAGWKQSII